MWMNSPPHRENLLEKNWRQIGLSVKQFDSAPGVYHGLRRHDRDRRLRRATS